MSEQPKDDKHWEQYRKPNGSKMKKIKLIGIMFFLSLCSYFVVIYDNTIRTVEFLSIFAAGAMGGILGIRIEDYLKNKKDTDSDSQAENN